jgi:polyferredoxin
LKEKRTTKAKSLIIARGAERGKAIPQWRRTEFIIAFVSIVLASMFLNGFWSAFTCPVPILFMFVSMMIGLFVAMGKRVLHIKSKERLTELAIWAAWLYMIMFVIAAAFVKC